MNLKKIIAGVLAMTVMGVGVPTFSAVIPNASVTANASAEEDHTMETYGDFTINKYSDHVEIIKYNGNAAKVEIPSKIGGLPVTSIGKVAFFHHKGLTSIIIPDSVTGIENEAFSCCYGLTSITIPDSVTSIGYEAFAFTNLESVTIPDSVTHIGGGTFSKTPWLKNKQKENPLVVVNDILIDGTACSGDVTIPDNVTIIAYGAFDSCTSLTSVTIPDSVKIIDKCAFSYCASLTSVTIPDSLTYIGGRAFYATPWLENKQKEDPLVIVNGILIDGTACSEDVIIPYFITNIEDYAFELCYNLTSITIMNPDCKIADNRSTISNSFDNDNRLHMYDGVIKGYSGSTAESYANKYSYKFESLGEAPTNDMLGDVNGDGMVDSSDASLVLTEYSLLSTGKNGNFSESVKKLADLNKDEITDSSDASLILAYYAHVSTGGTDSIEVFLEKQ